jgi:polyhydroxyalkanoate synthase
MGKAPPAFDILAWSVDGTNLPARLHEQFLDIFENNLIAKPKTLSVLGVPIDPGTVRVDKLITGALTDHLTPWKGCYRTTQLLGGSSTFVLSNAGHVASLVNPPGNPKANYWLGPKPGPDPDAWLKAAKQHTGTWWQVWVEWNAKRSGGKRAAPTTLGSERYPVLDAAPGTYVMRRS